MTFHGVVHALNYRQTILTKYQLRIGYTMWCLIQ